MIYAVVTLIAMVLGAFGWIAWLASSRATWRAAAQVFEVERNQLADAIDALEAVLTVKEHLAHDHATADLDDLRDRIALERERVLRPDDDPAA